MALPEWSKDNVAVVSGANRGIGFEIVRLLAEQGLTVVLTARDETKGKAAVDELEGKELKSVVFHQLDPSDTKSGETLATWLKTEYGGLDILVSITIIPHIVAGIFKFEYVGKPYVYDNIQAAREEELLGI